MKKNILIILLTIIIITISIILFGQKKFDSRVVRYISRTCYNNTNYCTVDLLKIFTFEWDTFYFFNEGASLQNEDLKNKFGDIEHGLTDRQIVFLLNNKVVYTERLKTGIEKHQPNEIYFDYDRSKSGRSYREYDKNEAVFLVEKYPISNYGKILKRKDFFYNLKSNLPLDKDEKISPIIY